MKIWHRGHLGIEHKEFLEKAGVHHTPWYSIADSTRILNFLHRGSSLAQTIHTFNVALDFLRLVGTLKSIIPRTSRKRGMVGAQEGLAAARTIV